MEDLEKCKVNKIKQYHQNAWESYTKKTLGKTPRKILKKIPRENNSRAYRPKDRESSMEFMRQSKFELNQGMSIKKKFKRNELWPKQHQEIVTEKKMTMV